MRCPVCGVDVVEGATYCHQCGQRLPATGDQAPPSATPAERVNEALGARQSSPDLPEEELWHGGYSSKAMTGAWAISTVVSIAALAAGVLWASSGWHWLIVLAAMLLPWLYSGALLCYRWLSVRYLLTTRRFVHERGILRRVNGRIELLDIDDVAFEQGLLERLLGVGTIRIMSTDRTDPGLVMPGIEDVKEVAGRIDNARLAERRRRGLHVEQI